MGKYAVGDIRNLAFVGHGAVGKTTLLDALLFHSKAVERKGSVDDGTSVFDYDDEEKHRKYSIDNSIAHLDWKGKRVNLINTPGYPDFMSQAISAIHSVETAVIVIDAHRGIEVNTRRMFEEAGKAGVARFIVLSKLDSDGIHFEQLVERIRETFGNECVLIQSPVGLGAQCTGVVEVLDEHPGANAYFDPGKLHEQIVERVVETDDDMMARYLEGEVPNHEQLASALSAAITAGKIIPIVCTSGRKDIGLTELLDMIVEEAPSPITGLKRTAKVNGDDVSLEPNPDKPFVAGTFKTHVDKFGNFTYFRVYQGKIASNAAAKSRDGASHRIGQLQIPQGKTLEKVEEAIPGDIICVAKVDGLHIGDTISADGLPEMPKPIFPKPMFPLAVSAKSKADDAKVMVALRKVHNEDPCFDFHRDEQTLEMVMSGLSQLHLEIVQHRLKSRDGVELVTHEPKIPYKETIAREGEGMYRHKKQSGGRGQFAEVHLKLHPRERGAGFEFINSVVGGTIPTQYIPAVEKGIREAMGHGSLSGSEVVDFAAEVHFGKYHDVDSSEAAFKLASIMAFREIFMKSHPQLLEPVVNIDVTVPSEKMGDINGDLNTRRAHITGMDMLPGGLQVVKAKVPLAELLRYQTELKSMTGGQGTFSMEFSHLAPVPPNVQQQVTERYLKSRKEPEEH